VRVLQFVWEKPVLTFYREQFGKPEREAFVVVQARRFTVQRNGGIDKLLAVKKQKQIIMGMPSSYDRMLWGEYPSPRSFETLHGSVERSSGVS